MWNQQQKAAIKHAWLLPEQRERVESPEFFQLLQQHVARRYLALKPKTG